MLLWLLAVLAALALACLAYGWFEAGWLRTRIVEVRVPGLPPELDGLRVVHLSDLHLGPRSRGHRAAKRAVAWVEQRAPDLVALTGDLVSHPRGEPLLRELVGRLGRPYVVLGNHDVAITRDPRSRAAELEDLHELAVLLVDEAVAHEARGRRLQLVGVDPVAYHEKRAAPWLLADDTADLRVLLCHFPGIALRSPAGSFDLILSGHLHAGQIAVPLPGRRLMLAHPRARFSAGLYQTPAGVMHVSPGTGTTFVPVRFCARPEATELVLRAPA